MQSPPLLTVNDFEELKEHEMKKDYSVTVERRSAWMKPSHWVSHWQVKDHVFISFAGLSQERHLGHTMALWVRACWTSRASQQLRCHRITDSSVSLQNTVSQELWIRFACKRLAKHSVRWRFTRTRLSNIINRLYWLIQSGSPENVTPRMTIPHNSVAIFQVYIFV